MNLTVDHPFENAVIHHYIYENTVFDVFLTGTLLFRRTDPIQAFATIAFSPFHAAFLTAILLHGYLPERRSLCKYPGKKTHSLSEVIPPKNQSVHKWNFFVT
ncbi:hypothetical protein [Morganella morganii]|uniref:hypothetical protein n=1 Tax=Morganella morganii TaxID=582 RepID=UPI00339D1017